MLEFGARFKHSRESLNVSIDRIAAETRISSRFLNAIENERFDLLPGGIFNRGFIRTYAQRLGLDPEEAIRGYEKLTNSVEAEPTVQESERVRGKTTKIPVYYVGLAGLLILVVVFYFYTFHEAPPLAKTTSNSPISESPARKTEGLPADQLAAVQPPDTTPDTSAVPVTSPPSSTPVPAVAVSRITAVPAATVVIELEVREESWFKLSSDGAPVVESEVLSPGTIRRYTAASSMDVSIGNAAGVALRVNGQPVSSLGRNGQVRVMTITSKTSAASLDAR